MPSVPVAISGPGSSKEKMKLIVCVDDNWGMMFNHRRQSQDAAVRADMLCMTGKQKLFVSPYTAGQFAEAEQERLHISECFLQEAKAGEYCFVEDPALLSGELRPEELVLYGWNRGYPADGYFTPPGQDYTLISYESMVGTSHPQLWKKVYKRGKRCGKSVC